MCRSIFVWSVNGSSNRSWFRWEFVAWHQTLCPDAHSGVTQKTRFLSQYRILHVLNIVELQFCWHVEDFQRFWYTSYRFNYAKYTVRLSISPGKWWLSTAEREDNRIGSVSQSVRLFLCLSVLYRLNRLTFDLSFLHRGRPWPRLGWDCRSRS